MRTIGLFCAGLLTLALPAGAVPPGAVQLGFPAMVAFDGEREARADALALQPDGRIVMVGSVRDNVGDSMALAVTRVLADGAPDPTFDGDGLFKIGLGPDVFVTGGWVGVMPDGRIVVVGTVLAKTDGLLLRTLIVRLLPDGGFDTSFSVDGRVLLGDDETVDFCAWLGLLGVTQSYRCAAAMLDDGSLLLATQSGPTQDGVQSPTVLTKLRPDGSLDGNFGVNGRAPVSQAIEGAGGTFRAAVDLVLEDDGSVVLAGVNPGNDDDAAFSARLARVRADGSVDAGFGADGALVVPGAAPLPHSVLRLRDGGYMVGLTVRTEFSSLYSAARFRADGRVDSTFGNAALASAIPAAECNDSAVSYDCIANAIHVDRAGRTYVIGTVPQPRVDNHDDADLAIVRFTAQGQADASWGPGGIRRYGNDLVLPPTSFIYEESGYAVVGDGAGRLVIAGSAYRQSPNQPLDAGMSLWKIWTHEMFHDDFD